ncbi:MAG: glycoside hydrolase family 25 protein [Alphaproteobacteria bacterium]|nr:glycoside hydrolase family 25 protein [Alphaproteobacteria bacterium]
MKMIPRVVDISHYERVGGTGPASAGFAKAAAFGIWGVIHKCTEARGILDVFYAKRRQPALDAGLLYGAYHFMRPGDVQQQVDHFLDCAEPDAATLLALDHEDRDVPLTNARKFMELVKERVGRYPVLYSGFLIKEQLGDRKDSFWSKRRLWLCHYAVTPKWPRAWQSPWLIQYTGDGRGPEPHKVPGIDLGPKNAEIDVNHYGDTRDQLEAEWAS